MKGVSTGCSGPNRNLATNKGVNLKHILYYFNGFLFKKGSFNNRAFCKSPLGMWFRKDCCDAGCQIAMVSGCAMATRNCLCSYGGWAMATSNCLWWRAVRIDWLSFSWTRIHVTMSGDSPTINQPTRQTGSRGRSISNPVEVNNDHTPCEFFMWLWAWQATTVAKATTKGKTRQNKTIITVATLDKQEKKS